MITNKGIELMSKYLAGQVPAFVSHIAIGCGANPLIPSETHDTASYATKTSLAFEMDRIPVKSRSVINIDGVNQMVFSAELPQTNRYGITEIGIYPAEKSNALGTVDSKFISSFSPGEEWLTSISTEEVEIDLVTSRLDVDQTDPATPLDSIDTENLGKAFFIDSDNAMFSVDERVERNEQPRYLSNALMVRGDMSELDDETSEVVVDDFIKINTGVDLSQLDQASQAFDKIKVAFSLINKQNSVGITNPERVQIVVEFASLTDASTSTIPSAKMIINKTSGFNDGYAVEESALKDLTVTDNFTWSSVNTIKIYVYVSGSSGSGISPSDYFIALDAIKFENLSNTDARYGLAGYTVAKNASTGDTSKGVPIIKHEDTASYVEFRFSLDRI
jgi:hypothetical protein